VRTEDGFDVHILVAERYLMWWFARPLCVTVEVVQWREEICPKSTILRCCETAARYLNATIEKSGGEQK
jgi:hypothetical protein